MKFRLSIIALFAALTFQQASAQNLNGMSAPSMV